MVFCQAGAEKNDMTAKMPCGITCSVPPGVGPKADFGGVVAHHIRDKLALCAGHRKVADARLRGAKAVPGQGLKAIKLDLKNTIISIYKTDNLMQFQNSPDASRRLKSSSSL